MDDEADQRNAELLLLELRLARRDIEGLDLDAIFTDEFTGLGQSGRIYAKADTLDVFARADEVRHAEASGFEVRQVAAGVVLVTYTLLHGPQA